PSGSDCQIPLPDGRGSTDKHAVVSAPPTGHFSEGPLFIDGCDPRLACIRLDDSDCSSQSAAVIVHAGQTQCAAPNPTANKFGPLESVAVSPRSSSPRSRSWMSRQSAKPNRAGGSTSVH